MAYVYDPKGVAEDFINLETLVTCAVSHPHWEAQLRGLIEALDELDDVQNVYTTAALE